MKTFMITMPDGVQVSDGFHTFEELYDHRVTLFLALCRELKRSGRGREVWRSRRHHKGGSPMYRGFFIMGISAEPNKQISYHLPLKRWKEASFARTLANAPAWDGHTPADVIKRLKAL
jgi:hypothetical protein